MPTYKSQLNNNKAAPTSCMSVKLQVHTVQRVLSIGPHLFLLSELTSMGQQPDFLCLRLSTHCCSQRRGPAGRLRVCTSAERGRTADRGAWEGA